MLCSNAWIGEDVNLQQTFGMTETGSMAMALLCEDARAQDRVERCPVHATQRHRQDPRAGPHHHRSRTMTDQPRAEAHDPTSAAHLRAVLGKVPTSVAVIASTDADGPVGVSVGSFTSVSLDPPLVGFFIARSSTTWPRIAASGRFCASVLGQHQEPVSRLFATRGADKFGGCEWAPTTAGLPLIAGSAAWFDCEIESTTDAGDHLLVLGRVHAMGAGDDEALVFLGGRYGSVQLTESTSTSWD